MTSRETTANEGCASAGGVGGLDGCAGDRARIETRRVHSVHGRSKPKGQVVMRRRPTTIRSLLSTGAPQHSRAGDAPPTGARAPFGSEPAALLDLVPMRLLRFPAVRERTGLSRSTIWRLERRGDVPQAPTYLGGMPFAWLEHAVNAWISARSRRRGSVSGAPHDVSYATHEGDDPLDNTREHRGAGRYGG